MASISTPSAMPTAICFMKNTGLTAKARKTTAIITAAAEMIRPVRAMPAATASAFGFPASWCSLIRAMTSTA